MKGKNTGRLSLSALLVLLMAVSTILGACGPTTVGQTPAPAAAEQQPAAVAAQQQPTAAPAEQKPAATAAQAPSDAPKDLYILGTVRRYKGEEDAWNKVIAAFEKEYNVKVHTRWQGKVDDMIANLQAAQMSGERVDLCTPNGGRTYSALAPNGLLMDITELMEPLRDRFQDGVLDYYTIGGKLWGFPYGDQSSSVLYYNKTMFDELGLQVPTTFDDLINIGKVVKEKKGIMPMIHQGKTQSYWLMYYGDIYGQTSGNKSLSYVADFLQGKRQFNQEPEVKAFEIFKRLYDEGLYTAASFETDADGMKATFAQQKAAMFFGGTWELASTRTLVQDFELGVTSLPRFVEDESVVVQHGGAPDYGISIPSFADPASLPTTMQFIEYILRPENAREILSTYQPLKCPVKGVDTIDDPYAKQISTEMIPYNQRWIDWSMPLAMNEALMQAVPAAMTGTLTPEGAAEAVQKAYDTLVKETGYQYDWWNKWTPEQWKAVTPSSIPEFDIE